MRSRSIEGAGGVKVVFKLGRCRTRESGRVSRSGQQRDGMMADSHDWNARHRAGDAAQCRSIQDPIR